MRGGGLSSIPDIVDDNGNVLATPVAVGTDQYQYQLAASEVPTQVDQRTGGDWEYVGQQMFPFEYEAHTAREAEEHAQPLTVPERRHLMRRVDRLGRIWRFVAANADADLETQADAEFQQLSTATPHGSTSWTSGPLPAGTSHLLSYTTQNCPEPAPPWAGPDWEPNSDNDTPVAQWLNESRYLSGYTNRWRKATVLIDTPLGNACSGYLARDNVVVTAAHCVQAEDGAVVEPRDLKVCSYGNDGAHAAKVECLDVEVSAPNPGWAAFFTDPGEDFAVLELTQRFTNASTMPMSNVGPNTWDDFETYTLGYPGKKPKDLNGDGTMSPGEWFQPNEPAARAIVHHPARIQWGEASTSIRVGPWTLMGTWDSAPGHSGGPILYRPGPPPCRVIGLISEYRTPLLAPNNGWIAGPRVDQFRQFVVDNLP